MREITFIVTEDPMGSGYTASAHWPAGNRDIFTEADTREQLVQSVREAVSAAFDDAEEMPALIHLHYVRDEIIAR